MPRGHLGRATEDSFEMLLLYNLKDANVTLRGFVSKHLLTFMSKLLTSVHKC